MNDSFLFKSFRLRSMKLCFTYVYPKKTVRGFAIFAFNNVILFTRINV